MTIHVSALLHLQSANTAERIFSFSGEGGHICEKKAIFCYRKKCIASRFLLVSEGNKKYDLQTSQIKALLYKYLLLKWNEYLPCHIGFWLCSLVTSCPKYLWHLSDRCQLHHSPVLLFLIGAHLCLLEHRTKRKSTWKTRISENYTITTNTQTTFKLDISNNLTGDKYIYNSLVYSLHGAS